MHSNRLIKFVILSNLYVKKIYEIYYEPARPLYPTDLLNFYQSESIDAQICHKVLEII